MLLELKSKSNATPLKVKHTTVYIVLGIDEHEHDQVLAVFNTYNDAKVYCAITMGDGTEFYDLWIEKHPVM